MGGLGVWWAERGGMDEQLGSMNEWWRETHMPKETKT